jgi:putative MATE family efflux protein
MQQTIDRERAQPESTEPSLWQSIREAVRGSHRDFTTGNLNRAILLLAIPMVLEMVLESLFAVVDIFWVGRLGPNAIATVGLTESMLTLIIAVGLGLGILLSLAVSVLIGVPCFLYAPQLLRLAGGTPAIVATGAGYTRIALGGGGVLLLLFLNNAIFRGAGDAAVAMRLLWVSNIINLALDPCLIFGWGPFPRMGVTGAAAATLTGRSIGVLYQFYRLARGTERLRIGVRQMKLQLDVMVRLVRVASAAILQFLIAQASWLGLVRIVSVFGATALAGYTVAIRIIIFILLPSWGLSNAAATLVGQNLGAGQPERAATSVWRTGLWNMIFLGSVGVVFFLAARPMVGAFTHDPEVLRVGVNCLRILCCGNVGYAYGMVMLQAFNGAGDTLTPTLVNLAGFWILELPLAWWLSIHTRLRENGVFLSIVLAEIFMVAASMMLFAQGRWKRQKI